MKNQYFGDINDYRKYGLLRKLTGTGDIHTAVCWMLTPDDGRADGRLVRYLRYPLLWNQFDSELFSFLYKRVLEKKQRSVREFEKSGLLPTACFFSDLLPDNAIYRAEYFKNFMNAAQPCDLIFFDPDNGIEVKSLPYGRKGSSKYLYGREIVAAYVTGHSVLIYQHFPRIKDLKRDIFIKKNALRLLKETGSRAVYAFRSAYAVFLLVCWEQHRQYFESVIPQIEKSWDTQFQIKLFSKFNKGSLL